MKGQEFVDRVTGGLESGSLFHLMECLRMLLKGEEFEELMILLNVLNSPIE
jgi:hypothetical protein